MTNSARDGATVTTHEQDAAAWLESLLAVVAAAPDFTAAADTLLARFCERLGADRGYVMLLDAESRQLNPVISRGYEDREPPTARILDDVNDPFVVCTLGVRVVSCTHGPPRSGVSRKMRMLVIPFSQPRTPEVPAFLASTDASRLLVAPCTIEPWDDAEVFSEGPARSAFSPYGVIVVETDSRVEGVDITARAARLAGPILARVGAADAHRRRAEELADQRS
ncbi:MAG TPA: hypothetical protein VIG47_02670, partial [Gemmatimonadaceae bacterium]